MKNHAAAFVVAVFLVAGCGNSDDQPVADTTTVDPSELLSTIFADYFERNLEMNPVNATFIGDHRFDDRLANSNSPEYLAAEEAMRLLHFMPRRPNLASRTALRRSRSQTLAEH